MANTRELIKKYGIRLTKSLGQNFLTDDSVVDRIIEGAGVTEKDFVIEIGPGAGTMTSKLCGKAAFVSAIEIDRHLIPLLTEEMKPHPNFSLVHADVLKTNIVEDIITPAQDVLPEGYALKVVANLPYYITTPIIMKFLEEGIPMHSMVLMVQKEVADRMAAAPGTKDYGSLSVAVQYYAKPEKLFLVPPHSFVPQPEVDSVVIRLERYNTPPVALVSQKLFFRIVKAAFGQRRKTLVNALSNSGYFTLSKSEIVQILASLNLNENIRGEALSIEQFANLSNEFSQKQSDK